MNARIVSIIMFSAFCGPSFAHSQSLPEMLLGCKKTFDFREYEFGTVLLSSLDSPWQTLDPGLLRQVLPSVEGQWIKKNTESGVPLQKSWEFINSCGPISVSMALWLSAARNGEQIPRDTEGWRKFILGFPYFVGGVMPDKLVEHANSPYRRLPGVRKMVAKPYSACSDAMAEIKKQVKQGKPAMVLMVQCSLAQHYVNVVGVNEETEHFLLLDPMGMLKIVSFDWLEQVMYAGIRLDEGLPYFLSSLAAVPIFSLATSYKYFNVFVFEDWDN